MADQFDMPVEKLIEIVERGFPFTERTGIKIDALERGYVKMRMPLEPNMNHVGTMYAGALFTLAEMPGGAIHVACFDIKRFYPIVKDVKIRFRRPATTDITIEIRLGEAEIAEIQGRAERDGKADYSWNCELKDARGEIVATSKNLYQLRKIGT